MSNTPHSTKKSKNNPNTISKFEFKRLLDLYEENRRKHTLNQYRKYINEMYKIELVWHKCTD